jgi:hypothetical protein
VVDGATIQPTPELLHINLESLTIRNPVSKFCCIALPAVNVYTLPVLGRTFDGDTIALAVI